MKTCQTEPVTQSVCILTGADHESAVDCSTHRHRIESVSPVGDVDWQENLIDAATKALGTLRVATLFGQSLYAAPVTLELERAIKAAIRGRHK